MRRLPIALLLAMFMLGGLAPVSARADGDPASDVLIAKPIYYPYTPPVSAKVGGLLVKATRETQQTRHPIRVAIIGGAGDLGAVPDFFGRPQEYAKFLASELKFAYRGGLLIVMPAGFGVHNVSSKAVASLRGLAVGSGGGSDELGRAAVLAVQRLAGAGGHPIAPVLREGQAAGASWLRAVVALVIAAALALMGVLLTFRVRSRRGSELVSA